MSLAMTCRHCGRDITGVDEDALVAAVQDHISSHDAGHVPSRAHILSRFARVQRRRSAD